MPATMVEPEELELPVAHNPEPAYETRPANLKQRVRNLLVTMFEGHEEFLGYTPD